MVVSEGEKSNFLCYWSGRVLLTSDRVRDRLLPDWRATLENISAIIKLVDVTATGNPVDPPVSKPNKGKYL